MIEITVAMPAYNAGQYIQQAIESVLRQEGVAVELMVVDDGSTDQTAEVVASCQDACVRLLRNSRRMGIGYCHNRVLRESRSPFIAHVDADDFLMPGAIRKMIEAIQGDPQIGQVHCYFFNVDAQGRTTKKAFHDRWAKLRESRPPTLDYKAKLALGVNVINHLRTYRRVALEELGGFNEKLRFGIDYDMALRLLEHYTIKLVPEFLYCRRIHGSNTTTSMRCKTLRDRMQTYRIRKQLVRERKVQFLASMHFDLSRVICEEVANALGRVSKQSKRALRHTRVFLRWRILAPASALLYHSIVRHLSWWPLGLFPTRPAPSPAAEKRIVYYLWSFPTLSETFIQREVAALMKAGISLEVIAHEAQNVKYLGDDAKSLMEKTHYLKPIKQGQLARYMWALFQRSPLSFMNMFLYVTFHQYDTRKSFGLDLHVFVRAVRLAGVSQERGAGHLHAPWASIDAFVALVAARLLRIPYTVQARAYDIHRHRFAYSLPEKLVNAEFVITNSHYNESIIKALLPAGSREKIHTIYGGIDLSRFQPDNGRQGSDAVLRILSVANLIEAKGLEYLLGACKVLRDRGYRVQCEVIGRKIAHSINYYIKLQ